jgi:hypothetical protein
MVGIAEHARGSEAADDSQLLEFESPRVIDRVVVREVLYYGFYTKYCPLYT